MEKIFISTTSFGQYSLDSIELLKSKNIEYVFNDKGRKLSEEEVPILFKSFSGIIAGTETYSKTILEKLPHLKVISRVGVGLDNIDLDFARDLNIKIFKTKTTPATAVVELALGLIIDVLRKISFQNHCLKKNIWEKKMGSLFTGKTLGIIGLGKIGKKMIELTKGFDLKYLAFDINPDEVFAEKYNVKYCNLNELLSKSDVVTIHLSLSDDNKNLINFDKLKMMKKEAILINTSRGEIIDELGLRNAIDQKIIAGAGLDVFWEEPYIGPLTNYKNIITTPHIASYAKETRIKMELEATENLIKGLGFE